jgi:hypothetical protein
MELIRRHDHKRAPRWRGSFVTTITNPSEAVCAPMREFRDASGMEWRVSLTPRGSDAVSREHFLPEAYREGWLVFESAREKRRFAPVPADWETLTVEALIELCGKASPQSARPRAAEPKVVAASAHGPLRPQLQKAEQQLDQTLAEVCEMPTASRLDTGDLIRVEETLALATEAAKEAVSLRRKMRADRERAGMAVDDDASTAPGSEGHDSSAR